MALAAERPTRSDPTRPGPTVTAMPARSPSSIPAFPRALETTGRITSICRRAASSRTTPPHRAPPRPRPLFGDPGDRRRVRLRRRRGAFFQHLGGVEDLPGPRELHLGLHV